MAHLGRKETATGTERVTNWSASARVKVVSFGVGLVSFLVTEFIHFLLVPDIGRHWERPPGCCMPRTNAGKLHCCECRLFPR
jgi:hypothetical protein